MPAQAQAHPARLHEARMAGRDGEGAFAAGATPDARPDPAPAEDGGRYAVGATTSTPIIGPGYTWLPLGPGNEAMEGGASPAPRGYTGGAMGRVVAGLSRSFVEAARGIPPPGGPELYTPAAAAATFRETDQETPPDVRRTPRQAPMDAPETPDDRAGGVTQA